MKTFTTTTTINASPETVWAILTDASAYTDWDPGMLKLEGTVAPGHELTIHTKADPDRAFKPKVTVFEPHTKMVWASGMPFGLFDGERTFTLEPIGSGQTRFTMTEVFTGPMMVLIGNSIPDLTATFEAFAAALKERAEAMPVS